MMTWMMRTKENSERLEKPNGKRKYEPQLEIGKGPVKAKAEAEAE